MLPKTRILTLALLTLGLAAPLRGSQEELTEEAAEEESYWKLEEQVVSLATKRPTRAGEAPAIVSVITAKEIREHGYRSVGEALRWVPGFYALDDLALTNVGVRGVNAGDRGGSRILKVMVDGQPIAFRSTQVNFLGAELIPIEAVDKIEVVRGPGSALYGANAFLGVVNVVTKNGRDLDGGTLAGTGEYQEITHHGGGGGQLVVGGQHGNLEATAGAAYFHYDRSGVMMPDTSPLYTAQRLADRIRSVDNVAEPVNFYSRIAYDAEQMGKVTLHGGLQRLDTVTDFQGFEPLPFVGSPPFTEPVKTRQQINNGFARLLHELKPVAGLDTAVSVAYAAGGPDNGDVYDTGQPSTFFHRQYGYQSFDLTASVGYQVHERVHLTLGMDHTADYHQLLTYEAEDRVTGGRTELNPPATRTINNSGLYGQGILSPTDQLSFTLGVRWDDNSIYGDQVNGRVGAVYRLTEKLSLKGLFGTSFQAPSPELLFGTLPQQGEVRGNPDLGPQNARSWELGIGYRGEKSGMFVNAFYNEIKDLAVFVPEVGGTLHAENAKDLDSYGLEYESFARSDNLAFKFTVAYQRTLARERGERQSLNLFPTREKDLFPRWVVTFGPSYKFDFAPLVMSWDNMWVDERLASVSNVAANNSPYELAEYFISTLTFSTLERKVVGNVQSWAMFQVVDLFDERPFDPGFNGTDLPSLGRRYVVTIGMRF